MESISKEKFLKDLSIKLPKTQSMKVLQT